MGIWGEHGVHPCCCLSGWCPLWWTLSFWSIKVTAVSLLLLTEGPHSSGSFTAPAREKFGRASSGSSLGSQGPEAVLGLFPLRVPVIVGTREPQRPSIPRKGKVGLFAPGPSPMPFWVPLTIPSSWPLL